MNTRKYGRVTLPTSGPYTDAPKPPKKRKPKRPGTRVVCRICGYGHVTLYKDDKGMICRDCLEALRKERG